jgi:hypothetical protein
VFVLPQLSAPLPRICGGSFFDLNICIPGCRHVVHVSSLILNIYSFKEKRRGGEALQPDYGYLVVVPFRDYRLKIHFAIFKRILRSPMKHAQHRRCADTHTCDKEAKGRGKQERASRRI